MRTVEVLHNLNGNHDKRPIVLIFSPEYREEARKGLRGLIREKTVRIGHKERTKTVWGDDDSYYVVSVPKKRSPDSVATEIAFSLAHYLKEAYLYGSTRE